MATPLSSTTVGELFGALGNQGLEKQASLLASNVLRERIRETEVAKDFLMAQDVKQGDPNLIPSQDNDEFVYRIFRETETQGMFIDFRASMPKAQWIRLPRFNVAFEKITSYRVEKSRDEMAYYRTLNVEEFYKQLQLLVLGDLIDYRFVTYCEQAVAATNQVVRGADATTDAAINGAGNGLRGKIQRSDLVALRDMGPDTERRFVSLLIPEKDFTHVSSWATEDFGDSVSDVTINGFEGKTLSGLKIFRTLKKRIFKPGNIWTFAPPDMLGYRLFSPDGQPLLLRGTDQNNPDLFWFQTQAKIGMCLAGIYSAGKLELYNGQGSADDSSDAAPTEDEIKNEVYSTDGDTKPYITY